jgi:DNA-binding transcriptional MerR regulator
VTVRTLRYYDKAGLLSPSQYTESGYRLYTDENLLTLQQILALKFLGFSLQEIKLCLQRGPKQLETILAQQRKMMQQKRRQLDSILNAIAHTEALLQAGRCDWEALVRVIEVMQMEQKTEWVKKYFNEDQLQKMQALGRASYSEETMRKLAQREWTEADQQHASAQWAYLASETQRLAAAGADPAGEEAQALAKLKSDLLFAFTQGDPDIEAGLARFWQDHNALPEDEQPLASVVPTSVVPGARDEGAQFLEKAMTLYRERQQTSEGAS